MKSGNPRCLPHLTLSKSLQISPKGLWERHMHEPDPVTTIDVVPLTGWKGIDLGESQETVKRKLAAGNLPFDDSFDSHCVELEEPYVSLTFADHEAKPLVQMLFGGGDVRIGGNAILGSEVKDALQALGVSDFADTLWSDVEIDAEYHHGVAVSDALRPTHAKPQRLMDGGTLWIKSQGIGLCMRGGCIEAVVIRSLADVPKVGCGPLTTETLLADANSTDGSADTAHPSGVNPMEPSQTSGSRSTRRLVLTASAIALLIFPVFLIYRGYQAWQGANKVTGTIVERKPNSETPQQVVIIYPLPDQQTGSATIDSQFVSTTELGSEIELYYLPIQPENVLTIAQKENVIWSGYLPYVAIICPAFALMLLAVAFPKYSLTDIHK